MQTQTSAQPTADGQDTLRFSLLGPLDVRRGGTRLELGPPKRRALLVRLLVEGGHPVSADRLREDLWEGRPPAGAVSSLHAHISRLRAVLEPDKNRRRSATVLVSGPLGYALDVPPEARDVFSFDDAVQRARGLSARGRFHQAHREVDGALRLWRGHALADVAGYGFAAREIARLEESRTSAEELRTTLLLQLGDHEGAVAAAEQLTARSPLREAAWVLLMRALYLADRPAEALQRFETVRGLLAEELGSDPGPALSETHLAVLRHDVSVLAPAPAAPAVALPPPAAVRPLAGRADELAALDGLLAEAASGRTGWAVLTGGTGIGKTRLAEEFAARAADRGFTVAWARCGHRTTAPGTSDPAAGPDRFSPVGQLLAALRPGAAAAVGAGQAAQELAGALSQRPTVCLVDDVHRADPDLLDILRTYATVLRDLPLVIVCTAQDTGDPGLGGLLALLTRQEPALALPLAPLTADEVRHLLPGDAVPDAPDGGVCGSGAQELHRRSTGNPWVIGELLKLPPSRRIGPQAVVPPAVGRVLRTRLHGLDEQVLAALEALAVSGEYLDAELLTRVRAVSRQELLALVDAAAGAGLLLWEESGLPYRPGRYRMPELVREVLLDGLTPLRRQSLHEAVAQTLGQLPGHDPARLARHLAAAGPLTPPEELAAAALRAGHHCARDGRPDEALAWFANAADVTNDPVLRDRARSAARAAGRREEPLPLSGTARPAGIPAPRRGGAAAQPPGDRPGREPAEPAPAPGRLRAVGGSPNRRRAPAARLRVLPAIGAAAQPAAGIPRPDPVHRGTRGAQPENPAPGGGVCTTAPTRRAR